MGIGSAEFQSVLLREPKGARDLEGNHELVDPGPPRIGPVRPAGHQGSAFHRQAAASSWSRTGSGRPFTKAAPALSSSLAILPVGVGVISLGWRSRFDP